uniref:DUF659 domain-containing protein n=1 Tax=Chenopodium quinoa TaxID=63459 RepID=A0A803LF75_CHEQI
MPYSSSLSPRPSATHRRADNRRRFTCCCWSRPSLSSPSLRRLQPTFTETQTSLAARCSSSATTPVSPATSPPDHHQVSGCRCSSSATSPPPSTVRRHSPATSPPPGMSSSSSASCNVSGSSNSSESMKDLYPLWKFVVKGDKISGGGGNYNWKCNFCGEVKNGSYTRVKAHLLSEQGKGIQTCNKVKIDDLAKLRSLHRESEDYKKSLLPKVPPFSNEPISSHTSTEATSMRLGSFDNVKKRKSKNTISDAFNVKSRDHLDSEIARMFYTGGLPFNLARNPYYVSSYTMVANSNLSGYKPPGYNKLRTTLLCKETENVDRLLQPMKATWKTKGVRIVSDGWSDPQRRPLINIMIASETGPMFMKAIDCSGEIKDKDFIATLLSEVIDF